MRHALTGCRVIRWTVLAGSAFVLSTGLMATSAAEPVLAGSCFAVADEVVCVDEPVIVSMPPIMPPMVVPIPAGGEGSDESVMIQDNGGYEQDNG